MFGICATWCTLSSSSSPVELIDHSLSGINWNSIQYSWVPEFSDDGLSIIGFCVCIPSDTQSLPSQAQLLWWIIYCSTCSSPPIHPRMKQTRPEPGEHSPHWYPVCCGKWWDYAGHRCRRGRQEIGQFWWFLVCPSSVCLSGQGVK